MKRSASFFTASTLQPNATATGLPVAARADEVSLARRFELKHNLAPRFARRRQQRRQGQALLLAVLIMLLAALLSAGFLAVVSGNLNQTARIADKTKAIEASRAGIAYANAQLSGSSQGDLWRPIDVSPAPNPGTAAYNFYYSQLEKVQGWAAKPQPVRADFASDEDFRLARQNYYNETFGKFPDPQSPTTGDAPKFLVKVEELPTVLPTNSPEYQHRGSLKITSIGLSDDDPNVFHKSVAYKNGRKKSPWAQALRSVSNWNFDEGAVPQVIVTSVVPDATAGTTKVTFIDSAVQAAFPAVPFNAVLSHKDALPTNSNSFGGVVTATAAVALSNPAQTEYTLAGVASTGFVAGDSMQIAAALGTSRTIDLLNSGKTPTSALPLLFPIQEQPKGILANGSLWLQGQYQLTGLEKTRNKIQASGAVFLSGSTAVTGQNPVKADSDVATGGRLSPSSSADFPGNFATTAGVQKTDLVNDAWNKLGAPKPLGLDYSGDQARVVEPFTPAKIDSAENLARYRALTRNADSDSDGYKLGVYIDNRDDIEKVGTTAMTQKQLVDMLLSPPSTTAPLDYQRDGTAAATGIATASLEQKHLRGWVGADEFLARGALVEISPSADLNGNAPSLRVTLDARGDSTTIELNRDLGPIADKAWRRADGTPDPGVYTRILPWPTNGTIFAEGNLRIRGDVGTVAAPRSLTVVSLGNIYIEGSLSADNTSIAATDPDTRSKLMLLAKKNVIVNPTRAFIARTDVQTVATNTTVIPLTGTAAVAANFPINVANIRAFNKGDYAEVVGSALPTPVRGVITSVDILNSQLTINSKAAGAIPVSTSIAPIIVRSPLENRSVITNGTVPTVFSLVDAEKALNRRIVGSLADVTAAGNNKLVFDHGGDLKKNAAGEVVGLKIKADNFSALFPRPGGFTAELTNKQPVTGTGDELTIDKESITDSNKILRTYNNFTSGNRKPIPNPRVSKPLSGLLTDALAVAEQRTTPDEGYRYTASIVDVGGGATVAMPYHGLAGFGLRYVPGTVFTTPATTVANNKRQNFNDPAEVTIPIATSVEFDLNGLLTTLKPSALALTTPYFGFTPRYSESEDAITVDRTFYQLPTDVTKSTIDPRIVDYASNPVGLYGYSLVLRRPASLVATAAPAFAALPDYRVRSLKYEYVDLGRMEVKPVANTMQINAFVYAQEGSWFVIPGDYFRSDPPVRAEINASGNYIGSYIDYANTNPSNPQPDANEYITDGGGRKVADINRNGKVDNGEYEAALRFVRENETPIAFFGAIVENQTAVVADVANPIANQPPLVKGAVQDWMDKWATYNDTSVGPNQGVVGGATGNVRNFSFINYTYDPAIQNGSVGVNSPKGLRIPVTDDLIYQQ